MRGNQNRIINAGNVYFNKFEKIKLRQPQSLNSFHNSETDSNKETKIQTAAKHSRPNLANEYVPPNNETETKIAAIWQQVLGIDKVGIYDSFFDLG